jgi:hypothetical protein
VVFGIFLCFLLWGVVFFAVYADNSHQITRTIWAVLYLVAFCVLAWAILFHEMFGVKVTPEGVSLRHVFWWRHYPLTTILKVRISHRTLAGNKRTRPSLYVHIRRRRKPIRICEPSFVCKEGEIVDRLRHCFSQILEEDDSRAGGYRKRYQPGGQPTASHNTVMKAPLMDSPEWEQLNDSYLDRIRWADDSPSLTLELTTFPDKRRLDVQLRQVIHVVYSTTLDDEHLEAPPYWVGEAGVTELTDGGTEVLSRLRYGWRAKSESDEVLTYPGSKLFHVHLEGEIVLDVVCARVALRAAQANRKDGG